MANYSLSGREGENIDPKTAKRWLENYWRREPNSVKAEFFGGEKIKELLDQPGCVGMRIYYANDDYEGWRMILVGVDKDGNNIWPLGDTTTATAAKANGGGMLLQDGTPCPPYCPK